MGAMIIKLCYVILQEMEELPIKHYKKEILYAVDNHDVTIITAETGSGKTTQIPQFLIQGGYIIDSKIAIVLPRRIAAVSLARRVAEELGVCKGEVASNVRFFSTVNQNTKVVFMTDGMLVQQLYSNPLLNGYSVVVLDDIHERSISFEILFGVLKKLLRKLRNGSLKVILTSATLESEKYKQFFEKKINYKDQQQKQIKVANLNITGRLYQVHIRYLQMPTKNYFLKAFQTLIYIDREKQLGDVLVFLPSVEEIQGMYHMLDSYITENKRSLTVLMLHAGLALDDQTKIFEDCRERKIILATNIAESSITIPGIKYVVDTGYTKIKLYDTESGVQKMIVVPCGKASAEQRTGRAGRVTNGQCYRIYTQNGFIKMPMRIPPQLLRVNLANFVLKLRSLGIIQILNFDMIQQPPQYNMIKAIDTLYAYHIIDQSFNLTEKGRLVAQFSLDLKIASMIIDSFDPRFGGSRQILMLASMLEVERQLFTSQGLPVLKAKKKIGCKEGDFLTLINIFIKYNHARPQEKKKVCSQFKLSYAAMEKSAKIYEQLNNQIKQFNRFKNQYEEMSSKYGDSQKKMLEIKSSVDDYEPILRSILMGFFTNIAQLQGDGTYMNIRSKEKLQIHPTSILSVVYPQWIVYFQIVKSNSYYIYNGSKIQPEWIFELAGHYYKDQRKQQIESKFAQEKLIDRPEKQIVKQEKGLIQIGGQKKKPQMFKTSVLGLKTMKKNQLSFQQEI